MSLQEATNTPRNIKNKFSVSKKQQIKRTHQITLLQSTVDLADLEKKLVHTIRKSQGFNEKTDGIFKFKQVVNWNATKRLAENIISRFIQSDLQKIEKKSLT